MNALHKNLHLLFLKFFNSTLDHCSSMAFHNLHIVKHTYFSLFYQVKAATNLVKIPISTLEDDDLTTHIISGLCILYKDSSKVLVYPAFTLLFFLVLAISIVLGTLTVKKYIQCNVLLSAKLFILTILSFFVLLDIYLVAFGKSDVLILFLRVQKDIFFIFSACFIGLLAGRIYFKGASRDDVLP